MTSKEEFGWEYFNRKKLVNCDDERYRYTEFSNDYYEYLKENSDDYTEKYVYLEENNNIYSHNSSCMERKEVPFIISNVLGARNTPLNNGVIIVHEKFGIGFAVRLGKYFDAVFMGGNKTLSSLAFTEQINFQPLSTTYKLQNYSDLFVLDESFNTLLSVYRLFSPDRFRTNEWSESLISKFNDSSFGDKLDLYQEGYHKLYPWMKNVLKFKNIEISECKCHHGLVSNVIHKVIKESVTLYILENVLNKTLCFKEVVEYLECTIFDQRDIILESIKLDATIIRFASEKLRNDREIIFEAVKQDGRTLMYASDELRGDLEVVLEAVRNSHQALQYVSIELQSNPELLRLSKLFSSDDIPF